MKLLHVFTIFPTAQSFFDGQFKYLSERGYEIVLASTQNDLAEAFARKNAIHFCPVDIPRRLSFRKIIHAISALVTLIRQEKPSAVFGHTPVGALCAMLAAFLCRVPTRVYYRHGLIYTTMHGFRRCFFKIEEQIVSLLSTHIVNVSHSLSIIAVNDHLNSALKQYVIGSGTCGGIDAYSLFSPQLLDAEKKQNIRNQLGLEGASIVFGFCGRICNDKGIPELLDGFELFQKNNSEKKAKLVLIGSIDSRDGISEVRQHQINANHDIIVTGLVPKKEIPYYYSVLDVFVFPSHREGFGMCVLEASAMQKPILDSRSHGCIDAIIEHETGEYIDLTPASICSGMEMMLDANLRLSLGNKGRQNVLKNYDYSVMWPKIQELYLKILGQ